jgi:hypothetical protein
LPQPRGLPTEKQKPMILPVFKGLAPTGGIKGDIAQTWRPIFYYGQWEKFFPFRRVLRTASGSENQPIFPQSQAFLLPGQHSVPCSSIS